MSVMQLQHPCTVMLRADAVQDCGPTHPFYLPNYVAFYFAIKQAYPNMTLIANCQLGEVSLPSTHEITVDHAVFC